MVLPLAEICLCSIMDGVENGTIKDVHRFVPPKYCQRLLDMVLIRRKIDNPMWIRELSSADFLSGLTSFEIQNENGKETYVEYLVLDTQCGRKNDDEYLNKVADSLGSILEGGETIGAKVKKLNLNLYDVKGYGGERVLNRGGLVRLIGRCSNLKSLDLRRKNSDDEQPWEFWPILNQLESLNECRLILENLDELSVTGQWGERILFADHPIINFKKLSSLRLVDCRVDDRRWKELLKSIRGTLTHLHILRRPYYVESSRESAFESWYSHLPISLPFLKSLKVDGDFLRCSRSFIENLQKCTKLEYVYLDLSLYCPYDGASPAIMVEDEEYLKALNRIDARVEVKICIWKHFEDDPEVIDADSRFKMVSIFNEKITHLDLNVRPWNRQTTIALENVVDVCQNLTSFNFTSPASFYGDEVWLDGENATSALARLFGDRERAAKLREFELHFEIDSGILMLIAENCTNLDSLNIVNNKRFSDEHLIRWADSGARPSKLVIEPCYNVSDEGLIPILVSSGDRLKTLFSFGSEEKITDRTWRILIDHCPNVETVWVKPEHWKELAKSKCFNIEFA